MHKPSLLNKDYHAFYTEAKEFLENRIFIDYLHRFALGGDASCYRYIPQIAIKAHNEDEIIKILALSRKYQLPLTFRAYGSSLSGQACSDSILVITTFGWRDIEVSEKNIKLSCGVIGSEANDALKAMGKKIGPDPATITMASIGGIVSNNSSGMCCGVKQNSYQTIESLRVILGDGTILDTSSKESVESFLATHADMAKSLLDLRSEILADSELSTLIRRKYKIKNTTGYSLNALLDFDNITDILNHLFVGAEGTLGFISSVVLQNVDDEKYKACALLFYPDMNSTAYAIQILAQNDDIISSAEVMDYASLKSVQGLEGLPSVIDEIHEGNACILIQTQSNDLSTLESNLVRIKDSLTHTNLLFPALYSQDESEYSAWWKIRKGLLPIASSLREDGSSVITEDVCFEIEKFGEGVKFLQYLFEKYGFKDNGIIFGHALSGNVHFIITPNLNDAVQRENFEKLVEEMAQGVANMGGSIKAEHGTGRMVAPFVEIEWGKKAYQINRKIKQIFDKANLINPDVIITDNPTIHTQNLKEMTKVDDFINKCMECGFCEKACPSNPLTLTPRQRIAVMREIQRLQNLGTQDAHELRDEMINEYVYVGDETCAACSMCATLCPLEIDTAKIALHLRQKQQKGLKVANKILHNMNTTLHFAKFGLKMASIFNPKFLHSISSKFRAISPNLPYLPLNLPQANNYQFNDVVINTESSVVYFSTCINRAFAPSQNLSMNADSRNIQEVFESICKKAKVNVIYPQNLSNMCCGKAFVNYPTLQEENKQKIIRELNIATNGGKIPIVLDHSACSYHLIKLLMDSGLKIYDMPNYIYEVLHSKLQFHPKNENIALYSMCALKKNNVSLEPLAKLCINGEIVIDRALFCCGFAGNKGFFTPELNRNALQGFKRFYANSKTRGISRGFGSSSTCEIGLNDNSEIYWQHIVYLVDEVTR
ncbi:FAD-binding oxidoreductase [Helicobacter didelphidarum]|uniref:D-lactate dehydrogenase (cytochrome) n=1 Tax=Helicobacter didelphidarum TaxID=2040648 RepID=A0A3D8IHN7_9HELI|nr:FAD-binding and (Fe-S)-binding domain-containing protein [Helicobacter didelphidarum]RDU64633.1 FAD-binding oxidoreductase [Helicobacter didelphidarum]